MKCCRQLFDVVDNSVQQDLLALSSKVWWFSVHISQEYLCKVLILAYVKNEHYCCQKYKMLFCYDTIRYEMLF